MSQARIVDLADAVAAELNATTFTPGFAAERRYQVVYELKDLHQLKVAVVARSVTSELSTRAVNQRTAQVQVGFQQRINPDDVSAVDELLTLVEAVGDYMDRRQLTDDPKAVWVGREWDPLFDPSVLRQQRLFLSVLTLTYRLGMQ